MASAVQVLSVAIYFTHGRTICVSVSSAVIIVGAVPAGCILAARLTEDAHRTVILVEAGPDYGADHQAWPEELRDPSGTRTESHS
jgi:choline dehydrogenase-like flavoprotein